MVVCVGKPRGALEGLSSSVTIKSGLLSFVELMCYGIVGCNKWGKGLIPTSFAIGLP